MAALKLGPFSGIAPKVAPELLPDNAAQDAVNCRVNTGDLSPLRGPVLAGSTTKDGTPESIFRISETGGAAWLAWPGDVNCVRGPVVGLGRYYYTGDGVPKVTTLAEAVDGGASDYPYKFRALGVPKPITKATVTPSGGVLADVSRYYIYSFYDDLDQESAFSPASDMATGKPDGTWAITDMDAAPPNTDSIAAVTFVGSTVTITGALTHFNRVGDEITVAGVGAGGVADVDGTWTLTAIDVAAKKMSFIVTGTPAGTYTSGGSWTRTAPWGTCTKRIYRTSGTLAQFQLAAEGVTVSGATPYNDTLLDSDPLFPGDEAISASWDPPPVGLRGLTEHPSGAHVGFAGNELCISEPFQPHAYPPEYRLRTAYPIVAIAVYGSTIAVATEALPYLAQGYEPGQIAMDHLKEPAPCLQKRTMVAVPDGALYAGSDGLMKIGDAGVDNLTLPAFTKEQWRAMNPATMQVEYAGGVVYITYTATGEAQRLLVLADALTEAEIDADGIYTNPFDGVLHYIKDKQIYRFDSDDSRVLMMTWKGKEIVLPAAATWTAARVRFETEIDAATLAALQAAYDAAVAANEILMAGIVAGTSKSGGCINGSAFNKLAVNGSVLGVPVDPGNTVAAVTFALFADGDLKFTKFVTDDSIFRMPSGYTTRRYAVRVTSPARIKSIECGTNPQELARV